jgi:outer membrane protein assembly factor BamA
MFRRALLALLVLVPAAAPAQDLPAAKYVNHPIRRVTLTTEGHDTTEPGLADLLATRSGQPLSMVDVRETIAHFYSLGRFQNVVVDAEATPDGGVALRYTLDPIHTVTRVDFHGDLGVSDGTLRSWMSDRFGLTPPVGRAADVAATLEGLYKDHGYLQATVRTAPPIVEHNPDRTTLVFDVKAGPLAKIVDVVIEGEPLDPRQQVLSRLGAVPGQPYEPAELHRRLADYVASMRRRGRYEATASEQPPTVSADGAEVTVNLAIAPGPIVHVQYEGDPLPKEKLAELVPIEHEGSVDEDLLEDSSHRIEEALRQQGYWRARVSHERKEGNGVLTIVFHVDRGRLYRVAPSGVEITGNTVLSPAELKPIMKLGPGEPFVASTLDAMTGAIRQQYQVRGYALAEVNSAVNDVGNGLVRPVITVKEGPRVMIGSVTIEGNHALRTDDLIAKLSSKPGQPYYAPAVASDRDRLVTEYLNAGYASAQATVTPVLSPDGTRATLPFKIEEGPQTIVDHILIVGNTRTAEGVIRRELQLHAGQPLGAEDLLESQRRLSALGLFRRVRIVPLAHGSPLNPDVVVTVEEALRTTVGFGGGAEIDRTLRPTGPAGEAQEQFEYAPRGFFEVTRRNLGGKNRLVSLYTRLSLRPNSDPTNPKTFGFPEYRVVGTYREPRAFHGFTELTATAAVEQARRTTFNFSRKGINAEVSRRLTPAIRGSARYSFGTTRVFDEHLDPNDPADAISIDRVFPQVRLSTFSTAVSRDTRDDLLDPQHGYFMTADGTFAARAIGSQVGFTKTFLQGFVYRQLGHPHLVFAGGARRGVAKLLTFVADAEGQPVSDLPASERFFAGGDTTIRGFALDTVGAPETINSQGFPKGGNATIILNGELRAPLWKQLGGALFVDGGNVFARTSDFDLTELRGAVGFGVRYRSPIGPIRLDLGFKLDRRVIAGRLEPRSVLHFSIGQAF